LAMQVRTMPTLSLRELDNMARWFRLYDECIEDEKVWRLSGDLFKFWIGILCCTSKGKGLLPPPDLIAYKLRMSEEAVRESLTVLQKAGLLDQNEQGLRPHNWDQRQYVSDTSTERVKRFRQRSEGVSEAVSETPPETETETDTELVATTVATRPLDAVAAVVRAWNEMAGSTPVDVKARLKSIPTVKILTSSRAKALRERIKAHGVECVLAAVECVKQSDFLRGGGNTGWVVDFDFFVRESGFAKIIEGRYDGTDGTADKRTAARRLLEQHANKPSTA
jgi:hypothetical protein